MVKKKDSPNQSSKLKIRALRHFSEAFKRSKVDELEKGLVTVKQVVDLYGVTKTSVYRWIYSYSIHHQQGTRQVVEMESEGKKTENLLRRQAELERILGQKQLKIDYLEKLIELASEEYKTDLKKTFNTRPSLGLETILL